MSPCVLRRHLTPFLYLRAPPIIMDNLAVCFPYGPYGRTPLETNSFCVPVLLLYVRTFYIYSFSEDFSFLASTQPSHALRPTYI